MNIVSPLVPFLGLLRARWLLALLTMMIGGQASLVTSSFADDLMPLQARIKDIVNFEGIRQNLLVGYGLIVGLNGTGDGLNGSPFTKESLVSMLERLGVNTRDQMKDMKTKNVAAVMVTASLPTFARQGSRIDVSVSAVGDAKNLTGGTLLVTPLMGADGEVYAVAQGAISTSAIAVKGQSGSSLTKGVPTSGVISGGAIVEREISYAFNSSRSLKLALKNPDFTTAKRVADVINQIEGKGLNVANAIDPSTVLIRIPDNYPQPLDFMAAIEQLSVTPDQVAKVVIDEQNGIIVMGDNVRISTVAISQGNLTIRVDETRDVSQPNAPLSMTWGGQGRTVTVPRSVITMEQSAGPGDKMVVLSSETTLHDLVAGLNALGISPRDMITIIQNIAAAGALQAQIEVR